MIIHITQNNQEIDEVQPGTKVHLFAGALGLWQTKTRFVVQNQATAVKVLDTIVGVNAMANAGMDWPVPTNAGGNYLFYPDWDNNDDFKLFEVTVTAQIPPPGGSPGSTVPNGGSSGGSAGGTGGSSGSGTSGSNPKEPLPSWLIPAGIGVVALILLLPSGRK